MKKFAIVFGLAFLSLVLIFRGYILDDKEFFTQDYVIQGLPMVSYINHEKKSKFDHPLWYEDVFGGMPLQASGSYQIKFNIQTTIEALPGGKYITKAIFGGFTLPIFFGFMFTFLLLYYSYKVTIIPAFFGAFAYAFTVHILGTQHTNRLSAFGYLPLVFWGIKTVFDKKYLLGFLLLTAGVGFSLNSYHQQITFYSLLFIGSYFLWNLIFDIKEKKYDLKAYLTSVAGIIVGFSSGLLAFWPIKEYLPYSARGAGGLSGAEKYQWMTNWSFSPKSILDFIFPHFEGFASSTMVMYNGVKQSLPTYWGNMPFTDYPHYLGIAVVIFAAFGLSNFKKNKMVQFLGIMGILTVITSMGRDFPIFYNIFYHVIPYFDKFRAPELMLIVFELIVGILAAFGLENVIHSTEFKKYNKSILYIFLSALGLLILTNVFSGAFKSFMYSLYSASGKSQPQLDQIRFMLLNGDILRLFIITGSIFGIFKLFEKKVINKNIFAVLIVAVTVIDLLQIDVKMVNPKYPKGTIKTFYKNAKTPLVDFLLKDKSKFRVFPVDNFNQTIYGYWQLETIGGYSAVKMARIQKLIDSKLIYRPSIFSMLNVKYLITKMDLRTMDFGDFDSVFKYGNQYIFKNKNVMPRVFFVAKNREIIDDDNAFSVLNNTQFDPIDDFFFDSKLSKNDAKLCENLSKNNVSSEIKEFHSNNIKISVDSKSNTIMVLSEMYYPKGWNAYIDGKKVEIYRANYLLRSIVVPKGQHNIVLKFQPKSFLISYWVSFIVTTFVFIAFLLYFIKFKFKRREVVDE